MLKLGEGEEGYKIMKKFDKNQIREFIKENDLKTPDDVQNALKELFAHTLQEMLEAELDDSLGYPKNGKSKDTSNRRNGHSKKIVHSDYGDVDLEIPPGQRRRI
jgi:putative transposase